LDPSNTGLSASTATLETAREERAAAERQAEAARVAELERQAELARQAEVARLEENRRQAELDRQAEIERLADLERQAERARLAEIERLAKLERHAELVRQAEIDRLAELERLADIGRQTELEKQADLARLAELERREEAARQAAIREAEWHALEQEVAAIAMASAVGVAGSRLIEPGKNTAPKFTATRSSSSRRAPRRTNVAPPVETPSAPALAPAQPPPSFLITKNAASAPNASGSNEPVEDEVVSINSLTRTNYVAPKYPRAALLRELSGSVDVGFTVGTNGTVTDVAVLRAEQGKTFNRAAIRAVEKWRFEPVIENGVAVEKRTVVRLLFDLE
jgi:TonB family protein